MRPRRRSSLDGLSQDFTEELLMGAIGGALLEYMRPLTDAMDGSPEELEKALALGQFCFNLGLMDEDSRSESFEQMQDSIGLSDEEFADFYANLILPMLIRHEEMFPRTDSTRTRLPDLMGAYQPDDHLSTDDEKTIYTAPVNRDRSNDRYAPYACNSGKKYKFCCGAPRRQSPQQGVSTCGVASVSSQSSGDDPVAQLGGKSPR
jgi:hypothetical protein